MEQWKIGLTAQEACRNIMADPARYGRDDVAIFSPGGALPPAPGKKPSLMPVTSARAFSFSVTFFWEEVGDAAGRSECHDAAPMGAPNNRAA